MKKIISVILVMATLLSVTVSVAAMEPELEENVFYTCDNYDTATKLSNPSLGSGEVDGIVGDRGQSYSWSAVGYGKYMYIGTCFGTIFQAINIIAREKNMDNSQVQDLLNALFNGTLYAGDPGQAETENRCYIIKMDTETGDITIVDGPTKLAGYRAATLFNGKIYFAASGKAPYLVEVDPETDEANVIYKSQQPTDSSVATGIRGIAVYKDMLIATMVGDNGAYMIASKNPSEGQDSFEVICTQEDLFDYPAYHFLDSVFGGSIYDIAEYNDKLYMTVVTGKDGDRQPFALLSGQPDENGKWSFEVVVGSEDDGAKYPFGLGCERSGAANITVHDGYLYIGGYNDPMIALPDILNLEFENLYKDLSSPVCLWRLDENNEIEMIAGDANEVFPEGATGNMGAGFGSNTNQYVWRMISYDGKFYLSTFDMSSILYPLMQFTNGDIFKMSKEEWASQIEYLKILAQSMDFGATEDEAEIEKLAAVGYAGFDGSASIDEAIGEIMGSIGSFDEAFTDEFIENIKLLVGLMSKIDLDKIAMEAEKYLEQLSAVLEKVSDAYEQIRENLKPQIAEMLDKLLAHENADNLAYFVKSCNYLRKATRGFDLFVTEDGVNFDTITTTGFDDPYNYGVRVFAATDTGLCMGTANPFYGTQVWILSAYTEDDPFLPGDANVDGVVNIKDATYIQKYLAKLCELSEDGELNADANFDNVINIKDATYIQKQLAHII